MASNNASTNYSSWLDIERNWFGMHLNSTIWCKIFTEQNFDEWIDHQFLCAKQIDQLLIWKSKILINERVTDIDK